MAALILAALLSAVPAPPPGPPVYRIPRGTVATDVTPHPHPTARPPERR